MLRQVIVGSILSALFLSGCGVEGRCHDSISAQMINPETAEFFDFSPVTGPDTILDSAGKPMVYSLRVRAEDERGNTITQIAYCVSSERMCACSFTDLASLRRLLRP